MLENNYMAYPICVHVKYKGRWMQLKKRRFVCWINMTPSFQGLRASVFFSDSVQSIQFAIPWYVMKRFVEVKEKHFGKIRPQTHQIARLMINKRFK